MGGLRREGLHHVSCVMFDTIGRLADFHHRVARWRSLDADVDVTCSKFDTELKILCYISTTQ